MPTAQPEINITKTDGRKIDNLRVSVSFLINNSLHGDYEDYATFNQVYIDGLNGSNGTWNGSQWDGNFLYQKSVKSTEGVLREINRELIKSHNDWSDAGDGPILPEITILKEDERDITALRIYVNFTIDGQPYSDFEDIGNFDRHHVLELNGSNGNWNGTEWEGNFLSLKFSDFDEVMDPNLLLFFNILVAVGMGSQAIKPGGSGWKFRQII